MKNQTAQIYDVIKNAKSIRLSDLKKSFNVSIYQNCKISDSRSLMKDLNFLVEKEFITKTYDSEGLVFSINENF